jgi:hypothetical protein
VTRKFPLRLIYRIIYLCALVTTVAYTDGAPIKLNKSNLQRHAQLNISAPKGAASVNSMLAANTDPRQMKSTHMRYLSLFNTLLGSSAFQSKYSDFDAFANPHPELIEHTNKRRDGWSGYTKLHLTEINQTFYVKR